MQSKDQQLQLSEQKVGDVHCFVTAFASVYKTHALTVMHACWKMQLYSG